MAHLANKRIVSCMVALIAAVTCAALPPEERNVTVIARSDAAAEGSADASASGRAVIGQFGLDSSAGDPHVKPGDDFFAYANGGWLKSFAIPEDHSSYGHFDRLDELSTERVRGIIDQMARAHAAAGTSEQQIGDYYAAYMDEAAIEANGLQPAQADLQRIAAADTPEALARLFGSVGFATLFDVQLPADFKNPDRYSIFISESTLGLPDRDYYLKDDPELKTLRGKYVDF